MNRISNIKVVALDADDTLWVNEPFFRSAEARYFQILEKYLPGESGERDFTQELYENEMKNLHLFGYGAKGFMLSMIETGLELTNYELKGEDVQKIINLGKEILSYKIDIYDGVEDSIKYLKERYRVVCITKGDLLDQESKIARSGLGDLFDDVRVVSEKDPDTYKRIVNEYEIEPSQFLMIGNSLKSDILPVVKIGGHGIYIPQDCQWIHESVNEEKLDESAYIKLDTIKKIVDIL